MRINIYAEELPDLDDPRAVECVSTTADTGRTFFGARLYLKSANELHDTPDDDDRSAITIWGPRSKVVELLQGMINAVNTDPSSIREANSIDAGMKTADTPNQEPGNE